jgi:hypothetical protein
MPFCTVKVYSATLAGGGVRGRGLHTAVNSKIANLKDVFLGKYLDDFLSKNNFRISMT